MITFRLNDEQEGLLRDWQANRVACYMRVATKEQLGEYHAKENTNAPRVVAATEDTVKEDGNEHIAQQPLLMDD